jgi:hypothetical protein
LSIFNVNLDPYRITGKLKPIGGNAIASASRYVINMENIGSDYRRLVLMKSPLRAPASESVMIYEGGFIDKCPNYLGPGPET